MPAGISVGRGAEGDEVAVADSLVGEVVGGGGGISPDGVAADGEHGGDAEHGAEDLCAFVAREEFLEAVDSEGVELGGIFHFAAEDCGHVLECAEHAAGDVDPAVDVVVDPGWASVAEARAFCFYPVEEIVQDL